MRGGEQNTGKTDLCEFVLGKVDRFDLILQSGKGGTVHIDNVTLVCHQVADIDLAEQKRGKGLHVVVLHFEVDQGLSCLCYILEHFSQHLQVYPLSSEEG